MQWFNLLRRPNEIIPEDVRERLQEASLLQLFEHRSVKEQFKYITRINAASGDAARRQRIDELVTTLSRDAQYQDSRWKTGMGSGQTSA